MVSCAVKHDNVIFALTRHGGHLGYFEGGILLPNSATWMDRLIVEFSTALLRCRSTTNQQQCQVYTTSSLYPNCEPSAKKSTSEDVISDDNMTDLQCRRKQDIEKSTLPLVASRQADTVDKLAAEMVADILKVSASVVYSNAEDAMQNGTLANDSSGVAATKSRKY